MISQFGTRIMTFCAVKHYHVSAIQIQFEWYDNSYAKNLFKDKVVYKHSRSIRQSESTNVSN